MLYLLNDHSPMYEKKEKKVKKVRKRLSRMKGCGRKYNHRRVKKGKRDERKMEKDTYVLPPEIKLTYFLQKYSQTLSTYYLSSI